MGLGKIFWGLVPWFFDFRLNGFDLLPDVVGLLLVASGSLGLRAASRRFSSASTLCFVLAVLWPLEFLDLGQAAVAVMIVEVVLSCAMIWTLLGGIADLALERGRMDLARRAASRRLTYCQVAVLLSPVSMALESSVGAGQGSIAVASLLFLAVLIVATMILSRVSRARGELAEPEPPSAPTPRGPARGAAELRDAAKSACARWPRRWCGSLNTTEPST